MTPKLLSIAEKVQLLFELIKHPDGKSYTYDYVKGKGEIEPSTLSRIRSGQNEDPLFSNIAGLAKAFDISLDYFTVGMTADEAQHYLLHARDTSYLQALKQQEGERTQSKIDSLAKRAYHLDPEAIDAIEAMVDYVIKQKGLKIDDT